MKTFKLNTQILIICCALMFSETSALLKDIGVDGREYLMEIAKEYNWFQAWHECARRNRQLLTIDSPEKQAVINALFIETTIGHFWLGAHDGFKYSGNADRPFFWSATGKQFTYANWDEDHPTKTDDNQHCVLIWFFNKEWINYKCNDTNGFICEEKQLPESSNKNPNNASDSLQKFINDFQLKFLNLLKDNMAELNGKLENIEQVTNITQTAAQKILNKQEISTKELNHEITKQGNDLSDQLKRSVVELNAKFSEKQNFTDTRKNIVLINHTG